jgi:hypothetical protein
MSTKSQSFENTLAALGRKADEARDKLAEMTDDGAKAAAQQLKKASTATRARLAELQKDWRKLEPKKKAQIIAGVLGAIAAVTVPIVAAKKRKAARKKKAAAAETSAES